MRDADKSLVLDALQRSDLGHEGGMVTNFVCAFVSIDTNGQKWFHIRYGPDLRTWEAKGYMHHALDTLRDEETADEVVNYKAEDG